MYPVEPYDEHAASPQLARGRVLLSYGHDDACRELVHRVYKDLKERNWEPWLDDSIPFGKDWRGEITTAIQQSSHMLAFLSSHSTRKPGVCRQEIAIALGPGTCHVYTVLVEAPEQVTPPLIISHLQWLDMHRWAELKKSQGDAAEELYQLSLAKILVVLEENRPFAGQIDSLRGWLRPLDNTGEMVRAEDEFGGREWLLGGLVDEFTGVAVRGGSVESEADSPTAALERFRRSPESFLLQRYEKTTPDSESPIGEIEHWRRLEPSSRVFWLAAPPGWGKSAVAARLAHSARAWVMAVHFCRHDQPNTCDARQVVRTLAFQMATQLADYRVLLCKQAENSTGLEGNTAIELFRDLILVPLLYEVGGNRGAEGKLLIVLDAIDETLDAQGRSELLDLVASEFGRLPEWLGLVVTSRPESPVRRQLGSYGIHEQDAEDSRNVGDVRTYAKRWLVQQTLQPEQCERAVEAVMHASEGNFLYVRQLRDAVLSGTLSPENLTKSAGLPKGLAGLYVRWFQHRFPDTAEYRHRQRRLFDLMLAAREPLARSMASALLGWDRDDPTLSSLGSLCVEDAGRLRLFHRSLYDWLGQPQASGPDFSAQAEAGHREIASALWRAYAAWRQTGAPMTGREGWASLGEKGECYALAHLPAHLLAAGMTTEYREVLTDFAFAMRRAAAGCIDALVGDYHEVRAAQPSAAEDGLECWSTLILEKQHLLRLEDQEWPAHRVLLQVAVEGSNASAITQAAKAWVDEGHADWPWMRRKGQAASTQPSACKQVLSVPPLPGRDVQVQFRSIAFSAGAGPLVAGTRDGRVFELNRSAIKLVELRRQRGAVDCLVASPRGDRFASIDSGGRVCIWSTDASIPGAEFTCPDRPVCLAFSPDGGFLACGFRSGRIGLRALDAKRWVDWGVPGKDAEPMQIECGQGELDSITWAAEGSTLATIGASGDVRLWCTTDGRCLGVIAPAWPEGIDTDGRRLKSLALSKNGRIGIVGSRSGIAWVFDAYALNEARPLSGHSGPIYTVSITPCGGRAVTGGEDKTLRLWDLAFDDELEAVFKGHDHRVTRVQIDASGDMLYSASSDGTLRIWDRRLGRAARQLTALDEAESPTAEISALANGPDGTVLIGYKDGTTLALNGQSLSLKTKPPPHTGEVWAIAATVDAQRVASADFGGTVRIWNIESGEIESEDRLQMRKVYGLRYADPGRILCWGEPARTVGSPVGSVFSELGQPQRPLIAPAPDVDLRRVRATAFSPDGRTVFVGGQGGLVVAFDAEVGRQLWAERDTRGEAYSMSLSSNGLRLAYGGSDRVIRVRDVRTGRLLLELRGHLAAITSLAFANDGVRLVSASWDGTVRLWDTRERKCTAVAHVPGVSKILIGADGKSILAGTTRGELVVLDLIGIAPLSVVTRVQSP